MPRGARTDKQATKARKFMCRKSFVSQDGHDYLSGLDVCQRRNEVFERDGGICQSCGVYVSWSRGEMDHIKGGLVGRNDDLDNLRWVCRDCHRQKHVRPQFGKHGPIKEIVIS